MQLEGGENEELRPQPVFWSYLDLVWLMGILFAGFVVMSVIGTAAKFMKPELLESGPFLMALQFVLYGILFLGFVFVFRMRHRKPVMESLGWRRSSFGVWAAVGTGILLAIAVEALALLLKTPPKSPIEQFTKTPFSLFLVSITAVGFAPFFEELFFRGFVQPILTRDLGAIAGVIITGCLFGGMHLFEYSQLWQYGLAISLVGITLGYIRYRSGSVIPGVLVHSCFNSIAVIGLIFSKLQKHP